MQKNRLLVKAIAVLALAIVANLTGSDRVVAAVERSAAFSCAACFLVPNVCENNEDEACDIACGTPASGECNDYDPDDVSCNTTFQVYEWVECE